MQLTVMPQLLLLGFEDCYLQLHANSRKHLCYTVLLLDMNQTWSSRDLSLGLETRFYKS